MNELGISSSSDLLAAANALKLPPLQITTVDTPHTDFAIINSDVSTGMGKHWTARFHNYLFDPFGMPPDRRILTQATDAYPKVYSSTTQIQEIDENNCGWYCLQFLYLMNASTTPHSTFKEITNGKSPHMNPTSTIPPTPANDKTDSSENLQRAKQSIGSSLSKDQRKLLPVYKKNTGLVV